MKSEAEIRQLRDNLLQGAGDKSLSREIRSLVIACAGALSFVLDEEDADTPTPYADILSSMSLTKARFKRGVEEP